MRKRKSSAEDFDRATQQSHKNERTMTSPDVNGESQHDASSCQQTMMKMHRQAYPYCSTISPETSETQRIPKRRTTMSNHILNIPFATRNALRRSITIVPLPKSFWHRPISCTSVVLQKQNPPPVVEEPLAIPKLHAIFEKYRKEK